MEELIRELKERIVRTLRLTEVAPEAIATDAPLFGAGLGLDSLDALELVVMVEKNYGIKIGDLETARQSLSSVRSLARFITEKRPALSESEGPALSMPEGMR